MLHKGDKYHITDIAFISASGNVDGSCQGKTSISFDHLGRPMVGDINSTTTAYTSANLMKEECTIAINHNNPDAPVLKIGMDTTSIRLHPETGYAHIIKVGS